MTYETFRSAMCLDISLGSGLMGHLFWEWQAL